MNPTIGIALLLTGIGQGVGLGFQAPWLLSFQKASFFLKKSESGVD